MSNRHSLLSMRPCFQVSVLLPAFGLLLIPVEMLLGVANPSGQPTAVMWAMGALVVVMVVDLTILYLIFRDAMKDDANWLHGVGAVALWIGLLLCIEGFKYLSRTFSAAEVGPGRVDGDVWIWMGFAIILIATILTLILLGLNVSGILWRIRQERKAAESSRRLRGTLGRRKR